MPYCPTCKNEYPEGTDTCPRDQATLVEELPYQVVEGDDTTWVEFSTAATEDEAQILEGFLRAEGIPCQIESLRFSMEPVNFGKMGEIRIYVPAEHEAAANELLRTRARDYEALKADNEVMTDEGPADIADDAENPVEAEEP